MDTLLRSTPAASIIELKRKIMISLRLLRDSSPAGKAVRAEIRIEPRNILSWLKKQKTRPLVYWADREGTFEVGGVGKADLISGAKTADYAAVFAPISQNLSPEFKNLRYYGGICFDPDNLDAAWKPFGEYQFWLPRFELLNTGGETYFACNVLSSELTDSALSNIEVELSELDLTGTDRQPKIGIPQDRKDSPDLKNWKKIAGHVIAAVENGPVEKVVLARKARFDFSANINAAAMIEQVQATTPNCFHFCFQPDHATAFVGASPERLYRREKRAIKTEAIAGTRPRGTTPNADELYKKDLLTSDKDRREHNYVVATIKTNLARLCTKFIQEGETTILQLTDGQHLVSRFDGAVKKEATDNDLLLALHPTPAVAGFPTEGALSAIRNLEPFSRGWYAGPVGWVGYDGAEFAVAIRSGLIQGDKLSLYSGAGLVRGSTAEAEWNEIENKMSSFLRVFKK